MAFQLGGAASSALGSNVGGTNNAQTQTGEDLEETQTEALGFQALAGEAKVRLLPSPWPSDKLPPPTASLLSIASRKGLLAAAGPGSVIVAGTESVRQAFSAPGDGDTKSFTPQLTLNIGTRISQVAFSADEKHLVISAEDGGGLAIYDVQALAQGNTKSAFELPTNGISLRSLVPNPTSEKAELFAVVTSNGELMMANLKNRQYLTTAQGQVMKAGVSCVSWSNKGKQLVAGLGNGACYQMTPEGEGKFEIPRPPDLDGDQHVSSALWLENDVFLVGHTPTVLGGGAASDTNFHIISREPRTQNYTYRKLLDVCQAFEITRPPHHFLQRLKGCPPDLEDVIIVASKNNPELGLLARSQKPLSSDDSAKKVCNVYTSIFMEDARRAQMPLGDNSQDTLPIGTALDLSAREKVPRPLPGEEMDFSPGPLPALMVLNNEGVLAAWWIVYADSIRQGTSFNGLADTSANQNQPQSKQQSPANSNPVNSAAPAFGQTSFGGTSSVVGHAANEKPASSIFGSGGVTSSGGMFGTPSLPNSASPWTSGGSSVNNSQGSSTAFGKPAFGTPSTLGGPNHAPAFGTTGGIGNRASPWGSTPTATGPQTGGSTFGQPSGLGMRTGSAFGGATGPSPFGSNAQSASLAQPQSGFASFAKAGGFAAAAAQTGGQSPFSKPNTGASFGSTMDTDTSFPGTPQKKTDATSNLLSTSGFTLGSTFTGDGSAKTDGPKPSSRDHSSIFGTAFSGALGEAQTTPSQPVTKDADMEDGNDMARSRSSTSSPIEPKVRQTATKPVEPPDTVAPRAGGLFGTQAQQKTTPAAVQSSAPTSAIATNPQLTTTPQNTPTKPEEKPQVSKTPPSPPVKAEPEASETPRGVPRSIPPEPPLPPEPTSKASYAPGESSASSKSSGDDSQTLGEPTPARSKLHNEEKPPEKASTSPESAPLPPDFLRPRMQPDEPMLPPDLGRTKSKGKGALPQAEHEAALPADDEHDGLDDEGSGVDVAQEFSPASDLNQSFGVTPGSSFGQSIEQSPLGEIFSKVPRQPPRQHVKSLFGEVVQPPAPYLPPPVRNQESPRSPSPSRLHPRSESLRPENARSVSAPGQPSKNLANNRIGMRPISDTVRAQPSAKEQRQQVLEATIARRARRQAEEEQDLSDREDEKLREELNTEVTGTKTLDDFMAHQDYVGHIDKPGIPGQIERVYRDINSMIDTLGVNARTLKGFVKGHSELAKNGGRSIEDLDNEDWCLMEVADLGILEGKLTEDLQVGSLQDVREKLNSCRAIRKELTGLRTKRADISKFVDAKSDPQQVEAIRTAPLSATQASQQHELRKKYTNVQKLIAELEESITMLRTGLASRDSSSGKGGMKRPTVEAVTNTILKMTSMIEKKSGDIDVLENQMRKLRFASIEQRSGRENSPSALASAMNQLSVSSHGPAMAASAIESPNDALRRRDGHGTPRRKMNTIQPDEVARLRNKAKRRKEVSRVIQEAFLKNGPRIRTLE